MATMNSGKQSTPSTNTILCSVKPAQHVSIGDNKSDFHTGCSCIDVAFPNAFYLEVGEIRFRNHYTAFLTVKFRGRQHGQITGKPTDDVKWQTSVRRMQLMARPHVDTGGEDYFTITPKQMTRPLQNITALRLILYQPSPVWKDFNIEDIKLFKTSEQVPRPVTLPAWLSKVPTSSSDANDRQLKEEDIPEDMDVGIPSITDTSAHLQKMLATMSQLSTVSTDARLGRFDVEGSYEINLLSYT